MYNIYKYSKSTDGISQEDKFQWYVILIKNENIIKHKISFFQSMQI